MLAAGYWFAAETAGGEELMMSYYGIPRSTFYRLRRSFRDLVGMPADDAKLADIKRALTATRRRRA
jgi:hypothetical protein